MIFCMIVHQWVSLYNWKKADIKKMISNSSISRSNSHALSTTIASQWKVTSFKNAGLFEKKKYITRYTCLFSLRLWTTYRHEKVCFPNKLISTEAVEGRFTYLLALNLITLTRHLIFKGHSMYISEQFCIYFYLFQTINRSNFYTSSPPDK